MPYFNTNRLEGVCVFEFLHFFFFLRLKIDSF